MKGAIRVFARIRWASSAVFFFRKSNVEGAGVRVAFTRFSVGGDIGCKH